MRGSQRWDRPPLCQRREGSLRARGAAPASAPSQESQALQPTQGPSLRGRCHQPTKHTPLFSEHCPHPHLSATIDYMSPEAEREGETEKQTDRERESETERQRQGGRARERSKEGQRQRPRRLYAQPPGSRRPQGGPLSEGRAAGLCGHIPPCGRRPFLPAPGK